MTPRARRALPAALLPVLAGLAALPLAAQADRRELGLRLRGFERELAATTDAGRRAAAFVELEGAVRAFFGLDLGRAALAIDRAAWALRGQRPTEAQRRAAALQLTFDDRLLPAGEGVAEGQVRLAYAPEVTDPVDDAEADRDAAGGDPLAEAIVTLAWLDVEDATPVAVPLEALPQRIALPLAGVVPGDHRVRWTVRVGAETCLQRDCALSVVDDRDDRLRRVAAAAELPAADTIEAATLPALVRMLRGMTLRRPAETELPGARLLLEAEQVAAAPDARYYSAARPGQYWLRIPTDAGVATVRLLVPADDRAPDRDATGVPLVVALHGAGGSENLFFDGYGDGEAARLCAARGWYLCAPRSTGIAGADLPALIAALAGRFPIDRRRVFVVGHSMGAMQTVAWTTRDPEQFAAAAALGGGGRVPAGARLQGRSWFVAAGSRDFARDGAAALRRALEAAGADVTFCEYPDVEHLAVVQVGLPDVFRHFDRAAAAPR